MICSDLHIHSTFSDGILTPKEILNLSVNNNLQVISITDHDSISALYELKDFDFKKISIIPGIELSSEYKGFEIHLLGYFINIYDDRLISILSKIRNERTERVFKMIDILNSLNLPISKNEIEVDMQVTLGRPHIARLLLKKGYVSNIKEAFSLYLAKGRAAYIERYKLDYKEALRLIYNCGGISVLAHPGEVYKGLDIEGLVKELKVYGLNGIEVFHPSHSNKETNMYYNIAKKHRLVISGGSDYHGSFSKEATYIGAMGLDENLTFKLINFHNQFFKGHTNEFFKLTLDNGDTKYTSASGITKL